MFLWSLFFKDKEEPVKVLESLKKSLAFLNDRFEKQQIPNDIYLKKALDLQKKIAKYQKKVDKLQEN